MRDYSNNPACKERNCFACRNGECTILQSNDFGSGKCVFYKTKEQRDREERESA